MTDNGLARMDRAATIRQEFDRSFAELPNTDPAIEEDFIAIRLGAQGYALRLSEIAGFFPSQRITFVPSRNATFIGIAGFRGDMAPVFDLHRLLGHPRPERSNWLAVASSVHIAFAFEAFDAHLRVRREAIMPSGDQRSRHVREFIRADGLVRPIVFLPSILEQITKEPPEREHRGVTGNV